MAKKTAKIQGNKKKAGYSSLKTEIEANFSNKQAAVLKKIVGIC